MVAVLSMWSPIVIDSLNRLKKHIDAAVSLKRTFLVTDWPEIITFSSWKNATTPNPFSEASLYTLTGFLGGGEKIN